MLRTFIFFAALSSVGGCVNVPIAEGIPETEQIKAINFTCDKPYALTQDCSSHSFGTKEISISGQKMKVAGSENGEVIFVGGPNPGTDCVFRDFFILNCPTHSKKSNLGYLALRSFLEANNIGIIRVQPFSEFGTIYGYYLVLDADGYALLLSFPVDTESESDRIVD